jgi:hypothetical protein
MMFLCTSNFDLQEEGFTFLKEFFSIDEIEAAKEEREDSSNQFELDPISDTEEENTVVEEETQLNEIELDDIGLDESQKIGEPELPLARNNTRIRVLGRKRKTREDNLFESY